MEEDFKLFCVPVEYQDDIDICLSLVSNIGLRNYGYLQKIINSKNWTFMILQTTTHKEATPKDIQNLFLPAFVVTEYCPIDGERITDRPPTELPNLDLQEMMKIRKELMLYRSEVEMLRQATQQKTNKKRKSMLISDIT